MSETDWYDVGCSRRCRYSHCLVWGACVRAEEPAERKYHLEVFTAADGELALGAVYDGAEPATA